MKYLLIFNGALVVSLVISTFWTLWKPEWRGVMYFLQGMCVSLIVFRLVLRHWR